MKPTSTLGFWLLAGAFVLSSCTAGADVVPRSVPSDGTVTSSPSTSTVMTPASTVVEAAPVSRFAELVRPVGSAIFDPGQQVEASTPVALTVEAIGVIDAPIVPVGVLDNGEMEIPGRTEVGWYRFGAGPGDQGSAVLAAHIAYDNRAGVFRRLSSMELNDTFEVELEDGTTHAFEVFEIAQYDKEELPFGRVFAKEGEPVVALITCGGAFDRSIGSYEDNIVVYGRPVATE